MRRVLAGIDPQSPSEATLACARGLCDGGGELMLLHVAAPEPEFVGYGIGPETVRQAVALELRVEHRQLQDLAAGLRAEGVSVTPLMVQGPIVEKILDRAEHFAADFIVLGSKRHTILHDLIVGSVAQGVLRRAQVPVVLVPERQRP